MFEFGDAIKFAELAWVVYNYGFSPELNASRHYNEFFRDVHQLATSLGDLTRVIYAAHQAVSARGPRPPPVTFGWDYDTLIEIVGDFDATLRECYQIIQTNKSYGASSNPLRNVSWNAIVRPSVERLQQRILMHQSKIQHLLQPFEIDLRLRLHEDLAQRITDVHNDVRATQTDVRSLMADMQALKRRFGISLVDFNPAQPEPVPNTLAIPPAIEEKLESMFMLHPDCETIGSAPSLSDMADAFVRNFDAASPLFETNGTLFEEVGDTLEEYVCLLTCQFLVSKMLNSEEIKQASPASHWPRYVQSLHQNLQNDCNRIDQAGLAASFADEMDSIELSPMWTKEESAPYIESASLSAAIEHILELNIVNTTQGRWKKIDLLRYCDGSDRQFRLIITAGEANQPAADTRPVDFDLENTTLVPRYADPEGKEPLEFVLKIGHEAFPLLFSSASDVYLFQQALTGYRVADDYMPYRIKTMIPVNGNSQMIEELCSLQLWLPDRLDGDRVNDDVDAVDEHVNDTFTSPSRVPTFASQAWATSPTMDQTAFSRVMPRDPRQRQSSSTPSSSTMDHMAFSRAMPLDPQRRRRSSTPASHASQKNTRDPWNPSGATASDHLSSSPTSLTRLSTFPRRTSNGPVSPSRGPQRDQPSRESRASLSSGSSSSNSTLRRRHDGRQGSVSAQSINTTATSVSTATARPVSISGDGNTAAVGTLHCKPSEPMLVFFTRDIRTGVRGILALSLDERFEVNYHACACAKRPGCPVTVIEKAKGESGSGGPLSILRLGGVPGREPWWNILSLAEPMKSHRSTASATDKGNRVWQKVIRISMCFETALQRNEFAGHPCYCANRSEGDLLACLQASHKGRLGLVREKFRRETVGWYHRRYRNQVNMLDRPHQLGFNVD